MRTNYTSVSKSVLLIVLLFSGASILKAQSRLMVTEQRLKADKRIDRYVIDTERKMPGMIVFKNDAAVSISAAPALLKNYLDLHTGIDELRNMSATSTARNISIQKYQQYYKGVKVEHGVYIASSKTDIVHSFSGTFYDIPASLSVKASLSEHDALNKALGFVKPQQMAYEQIDDLIKQHPEQAVALKEERDAMLPKGELVIIKDFRNQTCTLRLAYKFDIYACREY